ncbi:MAG TPA: OmpA family protein [Caulobacteraceae bacterium]|jgi:outer membrane protein OmpA-like peptidoglycan-associated protein
MRRGLAFLLAAALTAGAGAAEASLRGFLVYFDFDRAELTPGGATLVREFATFYDPAQVSRIVVVGHADRAGEPLYNEELSLRRAETVAEALKPQGIDPAIIAVQAKGESEPQARTPDGVPEPLNRRAEIVWLK